jgi:general secretion pathway protein D
VEPVVAVSIPIPEPVSVQEAQELARAVQQAMEIAKFAVDTNRRMVVIKDRISKVRPAQALFEQLARSRAQVVIEVQFLEVDKSSLISYGLMLPNDFPIVFLGTGGVAGAAGAVQSLASFLFGRPMFGLGIANAQIFANMSRTLGQNLLEAEVRSLDGATATFHVGVKYPIATAAFLGRSFIPPSFNFEDLGLSLKITPHVHGMDEVSLDVNAEFKVLAGQSTNGMPILSNRKLESKVRLKTGQWAIVAGLMNNSEARSIAGFAGLSTLPVLGRLFRKNDLDRQSTEVVLILKPMLIDLPPSESVNRTLYLGSEGRLNIPL